MADALALGASERNLMRVRLPPRPPLVQETTSNYNFVGAFVGAGLARPLNPIHFGRLKLAPTMPSGKVAITITLAKRLIVSYNVRTL